MEATGKGERKENLINPNSQKTLKKKGKFMSLVVMRKYREIVSEQTKNTFLILLLSYLVTYI